MSVTKYALVTQLVEYQAFNLGVVGSKPTGCTNIKLSIRSSEAE